MEKKKILIAETSMEFSEWLCKSLGQAYDIQTCYSGLAVKKLLEENCPDVLVMDLTLPGIDGISLLRQLATLNCRPRVLLTTCFLSPYVEAAIAELGVDMVVLKPCKVELLVERIQDLSDDEKLQPFMRFQHRHTIGGMLMELNLPSKRRGFTYLEQAIKLYLEQPAQALTKVIYPNLAKDYDTNTDAVERAIRQVIHESWATRDDSVWRMYFCVSKTGSVPRPTNAEFISRIAERYRLAREEQA